MRRWLKGLSTSLVLVLGIAVGSASLHANARSDARSHLDFGNKVAAQGLWREAIFRWQKATEIDPTRPDLWNNRANALQEQGRNDDALAAYAKARSIAGDNGILVTNEALCRLLMGDYAGGWPLYESRWQIGRAHV